MWIKLVKEWNKKPIGEVLSVDDQNADILVKSGYAAKHEGDPLAPLFSDAFQKIADSVQKSIDAALKKFGDAAVLSRKNGDPQIFGSTEPYDRKASFGAWLTLVRKAGDSGSDVPSELGKQLAEFYEEKDLSAGVGTAGGFLIPTGHSPDVMRLVAEMGIVRPRARIQPMEGLTEWEIPRLDHSTAPTAGNTAYFGGMKMTWKEEGVDRDENDPVFKSTKLRAHELGGYLEATNTLRNATGVGLETSLRTMFAECVAWYEDYAFIRGTGAGQPQGLLNTAGPAILNITRSAGSAFALADAAAMYGRFLPGAQEHADKCAWVVHPYHMANLVKQNASGTGSPLVWMPDGVTGKPTLTYLGIAVKVSEKTPAVNVAGDVFLFDGTQYVIGDAQNTEIAFSPHAAFKSNKGAWRIVHRVDGQHCLKSAVTLADASSTVSSVVALAAG